MERLQKVIAQAGIASRRKAEELIKDGKVKVNGEAKKELGTKVSESDKVEVNNKPIEKETKEYYLLNKPRGVITTTNDEHGRKTVTDLIETSARIYPVGRLDYDTTGAILLTNDGEFANILMHPSNKIDKVLKKYDKKFYINNHQFLELSIIDASFEKYGIGALFIGFNDDTGENFNCYPSASFEVYYSLSEVAYYWDDFLKRLNENAFIYR